MEGKKQKSSKEYFFIKETLFFPKQGIIALGDMHIGYDYMLRQSGVLMPERQVRSVIKRLEGIFKIIKLKGFEVKKIIFLGDLKHSFGFEFEERNDFREIMAFIESKVGSENIILIQGNHDTLDYTFEGKMKPFYIQDDIAFIHGHKPFIEIFDKHIKTIVMGHLHPSVILQENPGVKKEVYKCFLTGTYKKKLFVILPSFLGFSEGSAINSGFSGNKDFSIVPGSALRKFQVHVIGKDKAYNFGELRDL